MRPFNPDALIEQTYYAEAKHLKTETYYPLREVRATSKSEAERKLRDRDCLSVDAWSIEVVPA